MCEGNDVNEMKMKKFSECPAHEMEMARNFPYLPSGIPSHRIASLNNK